MFSDWTAPARYNASGKAVLRAAMPGAGDHDAAEDRVPAGPQMVVLPAVQRVHVSRRAADRAAMAVLRVPVHAQTARRARGSRLPEHRAQEGDEAPGQTGVRGHVHDRGQRLGGRTDIRTNHYRADIGKFRCLPIIYKLLAATAYYVMRTHHCDLPVERAHPTRRIYARERVQ